MTYHTPAQLANYLRRLDHDTVRRSGVTWSIEIPPHWLMPELKCVRLILALFSLAKDTGRRVFYLKMKNERLKKVLAPLYVEFDFKKREYYRSTDSWYYMVCLTTCKQTWDPTKFSFFGPPDYSFLRKAYSFAMRERATLKRTASAEHEALLTDQKSSEN